jgi:uroporphyrinogen decarboxylase
MELMSGFAGLRVAAFESRRATEMASLIERLGGVASVSPAMREVAITENREAVDFAHHVLTGQIDIVIFMTGVGIRHLLAEVERHVDRQRLVEAMSDIVTIARGPKPVAVLRELGLKPTFRVPEPNTWREVLATIDREKIHVAQQNVGLQEYGLPNASLVAGLEARGARVQTVKVYRWELPEDVGPLEANVRALAAGELDVTMFTSSHQAINLLRIAEKLNLTGAVRTGLAGSVVASIGPTTSETLEELGIQVDVEPAHSKMGQLVVAAAEQSASLLRRKRMPIVSGTTVGADQIVAKAGPWDEGPFMRACRRKQVSRTPIWLMRQAGRYMAEYRAVREKVSFLELCKNPSLCAEVMVTAVEKLQVDAAIIFSDLLPILEPLGFDLEFAAGDGPQIHNPIREAKDLQRLRELESLEPLEYVMETVRQTRAGISQAVPVIGFAGAPFTLASYAIEGGGSRNYLHTKSLMYRDEGAWHSLMSLLSRAVASYLMGQVAAGAQCVQLFDSWVGCLGVADYRRYVMPYTKAIIRSLPEGVPVINFAAGNPAQLAAITESGGDVIGVDWRIELDSAWHIIGDEHAVQGNLDPAVLLADRETIRARAKDILYKAAGRPGHIFNLGHGIVPQTPVENVQYLVEVVRELSERKSD